MADNPEPIQVSIIAEIKGLMDGLGQATSGVKSATEEMGKSFSGLAQTITNLKAPFMALTGLLAGGAIFKGAIDETINWAGEVKKLSMAMGVNMEQASAWAVAMHTIGISQDTMVGIMQKLQMRVQTGAKAFEAYGIQTKAANGAILPTADILQNVTAKYQSMGSQTEKNAMLAALFGRSWMQVQQVMKITSERLAEAAKEAKDFGLEVDDKGVAQARNYKEALNKISLIGLSLANMIGQQLLPVLTSIGQWFGGKGAQAVYGFGLVLKALATIFYELKMVVEVIGATIGSFVMMAITRFEALGEVVNLAVHGKFKEIPGAFNAMGQSIAYQQKAYADEVKASWDNAAASMLKVWDKTSSGKGGSDAPAMPGPDMGKERKGKKDNGQSASDEEIYRALQKSLEREKDLKENWFNWSTKREIDYWKEILSCTVENTALYAEISDQIGKLERKEAEDSKKDAEKKAKEKAEVNKIIIEGERTAQLEQLDAELQGAQAQQAAGRISKQRLLDIERDYQQKKFAIEFAALSQDLGEAQTEKEYQQTYSKIEALDRKHQAAMSTIDKQAATDRQKTFQTWVSGLTSGMQSAVSGLIKGTQTFGQAFKTVMSSAVDFAIKQLWKMLTTHLSVEAAKTSATVTGSTARTAAEEWASLKTIAIKVAEGIKWIAVEAWKAMAAAYASISAIPVVGPFLAPAIAAGILGTVIGIGAHLASASGGWERVPSNQLAMIHKDEQVLPASYAEGLRNLVKNGGQPSGGNQPVQVHFNGCFDAKTFFQKHQGSIVSTLNDAVKNRRTG